MKAKTIDSRPFGWDTYICDNDGCPIGFHYLNLPSKERADEFTNSFNSALSDHVSKEIEKLQSEIAELKAEVERLKKENDMLRAAYKELERKFHVASASVKDANELLSDPQKLGEYIAGM